MRFVVVATVALLAACVRPGPHGIDAPAARDDGASFVEISGAWIRVVDRGPRDSARAPLVLVHGYGSRLEAWRDVHDELARDRRVVAFDQRGFGLSEKPEGAYGPDAHADDLLALIDTLGVLRPVLVGHSYGGGVALRAALKREGGVRGLALISTFAFEESVPPSFKMAKLPVVGEFLFGGFYEEVPGEKYLLAFHDTERFVTIEALDEMKALMAQPGAVYAALETVRGMDYADVEARYRDIDVPTVVVWGEHDRVVPLAMGKRLAYALDRPLVVLEGSGHMPMWERPASLVRALAPVLADADNEAASPAKHARDPATEADLEETATPVKADVNSSSTLEPSEDAVPEGVADGEGGAP